MTQGHEQKRILGWVPQQIKDGVEEGAECRRKRPMSVMCGSGGFKNGERNGTMILVNGSKFRQSPRLLKKGILVKPALICTVVLARNVKGLAAWYSEALFLKRGRTTLHTIDLRNARGLRVLIASAKMFASGPVLRRRKLANPVLVSEL